MFGSSFEGACQGGVAPTESTEQGYKQQSHVGLCYILSTTSQHS